jgi:hypothetical protein
MTFIEFVSSFNKGVGVLLLIGIDNLNAELAARTKPAVAATFGSSDQMRLRTSNVHCYRCTAEIL